MSRRPTAMVYWFYPNRCCLCDEVIEPNGHLCAACAEKAPVVFPPVCLLCGRGKDRCSCHGYRHHFERCVMPFYYEGLAGTGILALKKDGYIPTVEGFTTEMAEVVRREYGDIRFDAVTAVPLHILDRLGRDSDSARFLARSLADRIRVPFAVLLKKLHRTIPQKELSADRRRGNLLGAFDLMPDAAVEGKTVLLVDDVITTGSTLDECAKMLKLYGAAEVYAVTAACSVLQK